MIITSPDGIVVTWSPYAETLYGWTAAEAIGRSILELTPSPDAADQAAEVIERLRAGESWSGEFPVQRKDGTTFIAFVTDTPVRDDDGEIVAIVGVSARRDGTSRPRGRATAERRAAPPDARGRIGWDVHLGLHPRRLHLGPRGRGVVRLGAGHVRRHLRQLSWHRCIPKTVRASMEQIAEAREAGRGVTVEFRAVWPDGSIHWLHARGQFLDDDAGDPVTMIGIVADIDERKRGEAAVAEASRARTDHDRRAIQILHEVLIRPEFPLSRASTSRRAISRPTVTAALGGDWYDVFELPDHRIMIVIGDVAGHGIRATAPHGEASPCHPHVRVHRPGPRLRPEAPRRVPRPLLHPR